MPPKINPLKLNPLQSKTLVLFQELARSDETSNTLESGDKVLTTLPQPHGNHFHVGRKVVMTADATGLANQAVWVALERKGLIRGTFPYALTLTKAGQDYDTGLADKILHGSDH
ncbi:hypothetical protein [Magnetospirillum moscoviense]|uniref:Uncharacterized protein n=1 Tax=Magnetospirillum moscoviense TaxID=1437059 RepID=A0A178MUH0_9PROT|nr:hypothetical protein [Magnetospirillum moscoviense]MBF0325162.1 hypothetical protein [Alphaproteobacteria bacterium]OAN53789.1 hypothetical protein A6A05_09580 [Magnetospirillum moscoviense]